MKCGKKSIIKVLFVFPLFLHSLAERISVFALACPPKTEKFSLKRKGKRVCECLYSLLYFSRSMKMANIK